MVVTISSKYNLFLKLFFSSFKKYFQKGINGHFLNIAALPCLWSRCVLFLFDEIHCSTILRLLHRHHGLLGDRFSHGWPTWPSQVTPPHGGRSGRGLSNRIWPNRGLYLPCPCCSWSFCPPIVLGKIFCPQKFLTPQKYSDQKVFGLKRFWPKSILTSFPIN